MQLHTFDTTNDAARAVAELIVGRIKAFGPSMNHPFVLCLPTGGTPIPVYRELATMCKAGQVSFEFVVTVNLDEYFGLPADHPQSYAYFMEQEFFSKVDVPPAQTHLLSGINPDPEFECARYESLIAKLGGIHLVIAGIGANGHVAFNEPGSSFASRTRVVALDKETRSANARFSDSQDEVPTHALSMGLGTVLDAREVAVLATGRSKASGVQATIEGPLTHLCPGSALQLHPEVHFFTDSDAVSLLNQTTKRYLAPHPCPVPIDGGPRFGESLQDELTKHFPPLPQPTQFSTWQGYRPTMSPGLGKITEGSSTDPSLVSNSPSQSSNLITPESPQVWGFQAQIMRRASGLKLITKLPFVKNKVSPEDPVLSPPKSTGGPFGQEGYSKAKDPHAVAGPTQLGQGKLQVTEDEDTTPGW